MKKKKLLSYLTIIFIIFTLIFGVILIYKIISNYNTKKEIEESKITEEVKKETISEEIEFYQNKYSNSDIVGIIKIDNSEINTPVVQGTDNTYYLRHALDKSYSIIGSVFIDYENNITNSRQLNLYGHNSTKFNPPFKELQKYLNKEYYENHKYITLKINNEEKTYEIFSVYLANKTSEEEHMQFKYNTNSEWLNHFIRIQKRSIYENNLVLQETDNIIVLQTCLFYMNNGKLLIVIGKEIKM